MESLTTLDQAECDHVVDIRQKRASALSHRLCEVVIRCVFRVSKARPIRILSNLDFCIFFFFLLLLLCLNIIENHLQTISWLFGSSAVEVRGSSDTNRTDNQGSNSDRNLEIFAFHPFFY